LIGYNTEEHRDFGRKNAKKRKTSSQYLTHISVKRRPNRKTFFSKMISDKSSTNPESLSEIGDGRRIGWRLLVEPPHSIRATHKSSMDEVI
jgi:hypothetical protein